MQVFTQGGIGRQVGAALEAVVGVATLLCLAARVGRRSCLIRDLFFVSVKNLCILCASVVYLKSSLRASVVNSASRWLPAGTDAACGPVLLLARLGHVRL